MVLLLAMVSGARAQDADQDGFTSAQGDCNDHDADIHPRASELAGDNVDQNCDHQESCFGDADNDGARTTSVVNSVDVDCFDAWEGVVHDPIDCNDANAAVSPMAVEVVGDGVDENCDNAETCYADADADHFRTGSTRASGDVDCADPGEAPNTAGRDCDDAQWNAPFASVAACDGPPVCGGVAPPYVGDLSPANPGTTGTRNTLDLTGGVTQVPVVFVGSTTLGQTQVPNCPNLVVPFGAPVNLGQRRTDNRGDASLTAGVSDAYQGTEVWTVVIYPQTCQTSCASVTQF